MTRPAGDFVVSASMAKKTTSKALVAPSKKKHKDIALAEPCSVGRKATRANKRKAVRKPVKPNSKMGRRPILSARSPSSGPEKACTNSFIATSLPS